MNKAKETIWYGVALNKYTTQTAVYISILITHMQGMINCIYAVEHEWNEHQHYMMGPHSKIVKAVYMQFIFERVDIWLMFSLIAFLSFVVAYIMHI